MTEVTACADGRGRGGWRLLVDGRPYGLFTDLEEANRLLGRLDLPGLALAGSPSCDWQEDTADLPAGKGKRPNAGVPCLFFASRTVIWESPGMLGVRLCCDAHVSVYADVPGEWLTWVLPRPVPRGGHPPGFDKHSEADMRRLGELLAGQGIPPGSLPGLLLAVPGERPRAGEQGRHWD